MSIQDRNAGNSGDQLKHALLLEVLAGLPAGGVWSYVETHAGAGLYRTPHATALLRAVRAWAAEQARDRGSAPEAPAGAAYARLLQRWWDSLASPNGPEPDCLLRGGTADVAYPGSPLVSILSGRPVGSMDLVEADPAACARLREALDRVATAGRSSRDDPALALRDRVRVHQASFMDRLELLRASGPVVVLADPYCYVPEARSCDDGRMGRRHLHALCEPLRGREAVLVLFTSNPPTGSAKGRPAGGTWSSLRDDLRALAPAALRCFRVSDAPHAVVVAGWGEGRRVVRALPGARLWARSWLARMEMPLQAVEEEEREFREVDRS